MKYGSPEILATLSVTGTTDIKVCALPVVFFIRQQKSTPSILILIHIFTRILSYSLKPITKKNAVP